MFFREPFSFIQRSYTGALLLPNVAVKIPQLGSKFFLVIAQFPALGALYTL